MNSTVKIGDRFRRVKPHPNPDLAYKNDEVVTVTGVGDFPGFVAVSTSTPGGPRGGTSGLALRYLLDESEWLPVSPEEGGDGE